MNILAITVGLVAIFIQLPIWFYIIYSILIAINASELVWFLYYVYMPVSLFVHSIAQLFKEK